MSACFRAQCHALGLSGQALATLARVQERSVRYWWADGDPPQDVKNMVDSIEVMIDTAARAAVAQAEESALELSVPHGVDLLAYRDADAWWAAHPDFKGLPIQTHGVMLHQTRRALEAMGYDVQIRWATDR